MNRLSRVDQVSLVSFSGFSGGDFGIPTQMLTMMNQTSPQRNWQKQWEEISHPHLQCKSRTLRQWEISTHTLQNHKSSLRSLELHSSRSCNDPGHPHLDQKEVGGNGNQLTGTGITSEHWMRRQTEKLQWKIHQNLSQTAQPHLD